MNKLITPEAYRATAKSRDKYRRSPREERTGPDGFVYDSKAEMLYAAKLELLKRSGAIQDWQRQIPFILSVPSRSGPPVVLGKHIVDFKVVHSDGHVAWVEVKGMDLPLGKWKRKHLEAQFSLKIELVR